MAYEVIVLRPEADFLRVGVVPPKSLAIQYTAHDDAGLAGLLREAAALVIPSTGPKLPNALFDNVKLKLVQFNGAGVDRVDEPLMKKPGIPVCNVPGGSNSAMAEYAVASALILLRRFAWSDAEIRAGRYAAARQKMLADNLAGIEGLKVGVVGMGTVGLAVARALCVRLFAPAQGARSQKLETGVAAFTTPRRGRIPAQRPSHRLPAPCQLTANAMRPIASVAIRLAATVPRRASSSMSRTTRRRLSAVP
jgi:hypothetical protein